MNTAKARKFVVFTFIFVVLFLGLLIFQRSSSRVALFSNEVAEKAEFKQPTLTIKDFNRVQVKDGKVQWEVKGEDANYFDSDNSATLSSPEITINREDGDTVYIEASLARLNFEEKELVGVKAEGDVTVLMLGDREIKSNLAIYNKEKSELEVLGLVTIRAPGVLIEGKGLLANLDTGITIIERDVLTRLERGAKVPELNK